MGLTPSPTIGAGVHWTARDGALYSRHGADLVNAYWCGDCGSGPFEDYTSLARHNGHRHTGSPDAHPRPPAPDEPPEASPDDPSVRRAAVERTLWTIATDLDTGEATTFSSRDLDVPIDMSRGTVGRYLGFIAEDVPIDWGGTGFFLYESPDNPLHHGPTKWALTVWKPDDTSGTPSGALPDDVTEPQLRQIVEHADAIDDVMAALDVDVDRARAILDARDLDTKVHPWPTEVRS